MGRPPSGRSSAMSMSPCASPTPAAAGRHRTIRVTVAGESTDDEDLPIDAYLPPQRSTSGLRKKKDIGSGRRRYDSSEVSETESEDCLPGLDNRMTPLEAKQRAEEERIKSAAEEEA